MQTLTTSVASVRIVRTDLRTVSKAINAVDLSMVKATPRELVEARVACLAALPGMDATSKAIRHAIDLGCESEIAQMAGHTATAFAADALRVAGFMVARPTTLSGAVAYLQLLSDASAVPSGDDF